MSFHNWSNPHCHFALSISTNIEPKSYVEASKFECWNQATPVFLNDLARTRTWSLVDLPPSVKPIGYIYRIKHHVDGSIKSFKAILVVKRYK